MNSSMEQISNPTKKSCHHNTSLSLSPPSFMVLSQGVSPQLLLQSHDCLIAATLHAMVVMHSNPLKP